VDGDHVRPVRQERGDRDGVGAVTLHAQMQRAQAAEDEEAIEWPRDRAHRVLEEVEALRDGILAGYAADTLHGDTAAKNSPLLGTEFADRVIVTPHLGAQTTQAVDNMGALSLADVIAVLKGAEPAHPVTAR
jgi:hypothetical protein